MNDKIKEQVSLLRKYAYEFGLSNDMETHGLMMGAQMALFDLIESEYERGKADGYRECNNKMAGMPQFGVWHQGETDDECDYHHGNVVDARDCANCTALIPRPDPM